jgi:hypothetical protein
VLGGCWLGRGVLWVGAGEGRAVGSVQRRRRLGGGPGRSSLLPSASHGLGRGRVAGVDRGDAKEHGYRRGANQNSDLHSSSDLLDFHLQGVRRNARKRFKFEFLKFSTLGDQHNGQGFQSYFCYKEMLSFAEILFRI